MKRLKVRVYAFGAVAALFCGTAQAGRYSSYPAAQPLNGTEVMGPVLQNGQDVTISAAQLATLVFNTYQPTIVSQVSTAFAPLLTQAQTAATNAANSASAAAASAAAASQTGFSATKDLSTNLVTAPFTGSVARPLTAAASDQINVKNQGAAGNGTNDDTAAVLSAIADDAQISFGKAIYFPAGHYVLTGCLAASISGNASLHIVGDSSGTTFLDFRIPAASSCQDGIHVDYGVGYTGTFGFSSPFRMPETQQGQEVKIEHLSLISNSSVGHPLGNAISLVSHFAAGVGPGTAPIVTVSDVRANGAGAGTNLDGTTTPGTAAWLNGVYAPTVGNLKVDGLYLYGPQTSSSGELGITTIQGNQATNLVAGAAVLIDCPRYNGGSACQGINVTNVYAKGYMALEAMGGVWQGGGLSNSTSFGNGYAAILGGGFILDQLGGSPVVSSATSTTPPYQFTVPATDGAKLSVGEHFVLSGAPGALPMYPYIVALSTSGSLTTVTWASYYSDNVGSSTADTCTFGGSITVGCTVAQGAGTNGITLNATPSATIASGATVTDTLGLLPPAAPNHTLQVFPSGTQAAGLFIPYGGPSTWRNYSFTSVPVSFTNGLILDTPYATGTFTFQGDYCDNNGGCFWDHADPGNSGSVGNYSAVNVTVKDLTGASHYMSPSGVFIDMGSACQSYVINAHDDYDYPSTNTQVFLARQGNTSCGGAGLQAIDSTANLAHNLTTPAFQWSGATSGDTLRGNTVPPGVALVTPGISGLAVSINNEGGLPTLGAGLPGTLQAAGALTLGGSNAVSGAVWEDGVYGTVPGGSTMLLTPAGAIASTAAPTAAQMILNGTAMSSGSLKVDQLTCNATSTGAIRFVSTILEDYINGVTAEQQVQTYTAFPAVTGTAITASEASGQTAGQGTNMLSVAFSGTTPPLTGGNIYTVADTTTPAAILSGTYLTAVYPPSGGSTSYFVAQLSKNLGAAVNPGDALTFTPTAAAGTLPAGVTMAIGLASGTPTIAIQNPSGNAPLACSALARVVVD